MVDFGEPNYIGSKLWCNMYSSKMCTAYAYIKYTVGNMKYTVDNMNCIYVGVYSR